MRALLLAAALLLTLVPVASAEVGPATALPCGPYTTTSPVPFSIEADGSCIYVCTATAAHSATEWQVLCVGA